MTEFILMGVIAYLLMIVPRAVLCARIHIEDNRRENPKYKPDFGSVLPYYIPYVGGGSLCGQLGFTIMRYISYVLGILTVCSWLNVIIVNVTAPAEGYLIASMYFNISLLVINYITVLIIALRSAKTFESAWGVVFCFIPPVSYFIQLGAIRPFFRNADYIQ